MQVLSRLPFSVKLDWTKSSLSLSKGKLTIGCGISLELFCSFSWQAKTFANYVWHSSVKYCVKLVNAQFPVKNTSKRHFWTLIWSMHLLLRIEHCSSFYLHERQKASDATHNVASSQLHLSCFIGRWCLGAALWAPKLWLNFVNKLKLEANNSFFSREKM